MTSSTRTKRMFAVAILVGACALSLPAPAAAQVFINPSIGFNFGGDSGCPEITGCESKNFNWGISFGVIGSVVGAEIEFADTDNFYGETDLAKTRVTTIMGHFLFAPKFGPVQLYGLGGLGLLKSKIEAVGVVGEDDNQDDFGYDLGAGLMIFFGEHVGARVDYRYFQSFDALKLVGLENLRENDNKLNFNRFSTGVVFKF
jgi:opacity protein-like surface antigen